MRLRKFRTGKLAFFSSMLLLMFVVGWYFGLRGNFKPTDAYTGFLSPYLAKKALQEKLARCDLKEVCAFRKNEINVPDYDEPVILDFAFDPAIQNVADDLLDQYKPDLGLMVAMDASTGRILAMSSRNNSFPQIKGNPVLDITYPSASVFKVITAAAALEKDKDPNSRIPYAGRNHTLYKSQIKERVTGWKRIATLKEAFAKSINTVFGRIGVFSIGKEPMKDFSKRFWFNESIPSEFPVALSKSADPANDFELAEMASGFTQDNTMTALHGAMIGAAIANDGQMMEPYFLNAAYLKSGKPIYRSEPQVLAKVVSPETAFELRTLMHETVTKGTSKKSFRGFFRGPFRELEVGGKTGSLTDKNLNAKVDWFVGFAQAHGRKISVSVLTVNKKYWTVKSSYLARRAIETAFSQKKVAMKRARLNSVN
jgi:cell division protein FtsI/penicillin-binding protein 2